MNTARDAVISIIKIIKIIGYRTDRGDPQITSLYDELMLLEDALTSFGGRSNSSSNKSMINAFDEQIRDVVADLEYVLLDSLADTEQEEMDSFLEMIKNLREEYIRESRFSDQFKQVRGELLRETVDINILSLFGMAGIGKTHLAREIYQLPIINEKFLLRVWVTVGPEPCIENVLMDIAAQIECQLIGNTKCEKDDKRSLGEYIRKSLFGRRYFIVLDDIWSLQVLIDLRMWFPTSESPGSRLLLTTRLEEVAKNHTTNYSHHEMRFLKQEESWNLLCRNVFGEEIIPPGLEKAGRKIAAQCEGLPLLILEVAHLLSGDQMDPEYWIQVADKQNEVFTDAYKKISEVLLSSYVYLPMYLKACFLYMVAFPLNYEIPIPKLINLWIAEDLLEPNKSQTLEVVAVKCLEKLVSQSLVIGSKYSSNDDTIKSIKLHSTYWHLCVVEARKDKFLHVLYCLDDGFSESMKNQGRLSVQNNVLFGIKDLYDSMADTRTARSLLCTGQDHQYPVPICTGMKLLKVLDALSVRFYGFPYEVLELLRLKYLALTHNGNLPCSISKLESLQSLIVRQHHNVKRIKNSTCLPKGIWDMQELRHLRIMESKLPDPSNDAQLRELLTLHVKGQSCTEKVFRSIPKLKKLGIKIELQPRSSEMLNCFEHISILQELESLKCVVVNPRLRSQAVAPPDCFPKKMKKLSLNGLGYSWEHMSVIGSLPNLRVLKLRCSAFRGPEWETKNDEFPELEYLLLEDVDLAHWTTSEDADCFSTLKRLIIRYCYKLEEIPPTIGAMPTLERVDVFDCNPLVVESTRKIKEKEEENGNFSFQLSASSPWDL